MRWSGPIKPTPVGWTRTGRRFWREAADEDVAIRQIRAQGAVLQLDRET